MKTLFIEAKYNKPIKLSKEIEKKLPKKIGLAASIQFLHSLPSIKKQLKKAIIAGQVLGCNTKNVEKIKNKVDAFLYIGDGKFHPLGVAVKTKKQVFTFNPLNNKFKRIEKKDIENYEKRKKAALIKFLHAENIGILVSTKKSQYYNIKKLESLKNRYKNKKFYTFIADTINHKQLENFPFIQAWVNTACPRIEEDIKVVNVEEVK